MKVENKYSFFFIGLALFAMFFGSGNLIFPLEVGRLSGEGWPMATLGFLTTAVIVPFMGIVAMVIFRGHTHEFFDCLGKKLGWVFTAILLTVWIPLGSGPRCMVLAYSSMATQMAMPPLWVFSIIWSLIVWVVIYRKGRMLDILGYYLTPLLLACLVAIIFLGISQGAGAKETDISSLTLFFTGAKEGYNTMDLIASFFFSASIIEILRKAAHVGNFHPLKITLKAGVVGVALLALVYIGLIGLAAINSDLLVSTPKDQLLATVAKKILGNHFSLLAILAIFLACFTTSVALVVVFSQFLQSFIPQESICIGITLIACYVMSLTGLEGITAITSPVLQTFYPILIVLIIYNVSKHFYHQWSKGTG
jgi:LIVCS family branched-chain amino acid:cation transporter